MTIQNLLASVRESGHRIGAWKALKDEYTTISPNFLMGYGSEQRSQGYIQGVQDACEALGGYPQYATIRTHAEDGAAEGYANVVGS